MERVTTTTDHTMTTADRPEPPPPPPLIQSGKFPVSAMEGRPLETWKPTRAQVFAAARAFARLTDAEWRALGDTQRADYMIDANAALMAARQLEPVRVALHAPARQGDAMVCMTKDHADAYADLFAATDELLNADRDFKWTAKQQAAQRIGAAMARLRALASSDGPTT